VTTILKMIQNSLIKILKDHLKPKTSMNNNKEVPKGGFSTQRISPVRNFNFMEVIKKSKKNRIRLRKTLFKDKSS